jgi:hypothetical protein
MSGAKLAVSTAGIVKDAVKYKIAIGGFVVPIVKAKAAKNGVVRQYWPKTEE